MNVNEARNLIDQQRQEAEQREKAAAVVAKANAKALLDRDLAKADEEIASLTEQLRKSKSPEEQKQITRRIERVKERAQRRAERK